MALPAMRAAMEVRNESVEDAQQRRLAATRRAGDHGQPFAYLEAHVAERGLSSARIRVGEAA